MNGQPILKVKTSSSIDTNWDKDVVMYIKIDSYV